MALNTNKTYLIIGANGFIGRYVNSFLQKHNADIRLLLRRKIEGDTSKQFIFKSTKDIDPNIFIGVDVVIYLIGKAHDLSSDQSLKEYRRINVDLTLEIAKIALSCNVSKFIYISSVKAGGDFFGHKSLNESDQTIANNIYGKTKREAELSVLDIGKQGNMQVAVLRPALVYGPNQKGNLGAMLSGIKKGWFPPLPETNNKRSMVHIDNLVNAIFFVSESVNINGEVFVVADNKPYSSREIYDVMRRISGKKVIKWSVPKFLFDVAALISPSIKYKLNKLLGSEYYPSNKIERLGFNPKKTLKDMNETSF